MILNVSAEKVNTDLNLDIQCSNSTYLNITYIKSLVDSEKIIDDETQTTKSGNHYNYTLDSSLNNKITTLEIGYHCDLNGEDGNYGYLVDISLSGYDVDMQRIYTYIFFLLICLLLTFLSIKIFKDNKFSKDKVTYSELYQTKKRNEFLYYMGVIKQHLWMVGIFGVYLSLFTFIFISSRLTYSLGLDELYQFLQYGVYIFMWGLIPFILFWVGWIIIIFYKTTTETMKYQFGAIGRSR